MKKEIRSAASMNVRPQDDNMVIAVSYTHLIKALEKQYGTALVAYQGKKLGLTQAGRMLCQAARTMRQDAAQLQKRIASLGREQPVLRFGATLTVGEYAMPPVLAHYLEQHPDAQIAMRVADTKQLLRALDDGAIDFAIVEGAFPQSIYDALLFCRERFLPVCGPAYPLPDAACRIHDLLAERLLVREQGSGTRHIPVSSTHLAVYKRQMPGWLITTSVVPAWCVMAVPETSGVWLNVSAPPAVVAWEVLSTVANTSGVPLPPASPRGMTKSNTAASSVPELFTCASVPGSPVVTVPTVTVAAAPVGPVGPVAPVSYTHLSGEKGRGLRPGGPKRLWQEHDAKAGQRHL